MISDKPTNEETNLDTKNSKIEKNQDNLGDKQSNHRPITSDKRPHTGTSSNINRFEIDFND